MQRLELNRVTSTRTSSATRATVQRRVHRESVHESDDSSDSSGGWRCPLAGGIHESMNVRSQNGRKHEENVGRLFSTMVTVVQWVG